MEAVEAESVVCGVPYEEVSRLVLRGVSDFAHPREEKRIGSGETLGGQVWSHLHLYVARKMPLDFEGTAVSPLNVTQQQAIDEDNSFQFTSERVTAE